MACASYVIHIYRVTRGHPRAIVGIVEEVGIKERKAFTNYDELWEILVSSKSMVQKRKSTVRKMGRTRLSKPETKQNRPIIPTTELER